jgi:heme-degrading monooxygenase HmoA
MINRIWHGWTKPSNADAYEKLLREEVLPGIRRGKGFAGAQVLRRATGDEVEFLVITMFDSIEAVREFAGADYEIAVILPEAEKLLSRFDARATHYETAFEMRRS